MNKTGGKITTEELLPADQPNTQSMNVLRSPLKGEGRRRKSKIEGKRDGKGRREGKEGEDKRERLN